jgi:N6-adenosine-specific RNA methylase IME4
VPFFIRTGKKGLMDPMDITKLKAHGMNVEIYGNGEPDDGLLESVKANGILEPIVVTPGGTILSGHRRWRAALTLGLRDVPTREMNPPTNLDEQETLLEFNRQREKTFSQKMREAEKLKEIVAARAREKQQAQGGIGHTGAVFGGLGGRPKKEESSENPLPVILREGGFREAEHTPPTSRTAKDSAHANETTKKVATQVGMGQRTFEKAEKVYKKAESGDERAQELVKKLDAGTTTVNAAFKEIIVAEQKKTAIENIEQKAQEPEGLFNVIVIDPPWAYDKRSEDTLHRGRAPYPTLTTEEISAMEIPADNDCALWLWTTNAFMHDAYHVLEAWEFTPKTILTWVKDKMGLGDWLRGQTEHCILAVKGKPPITLSNQTTALYGPLREHSRKPDEFYALVDSLCHGRKLEMFSREEREGWFQHGAEAEKF